MKHEDFLYHIALKQDWEQAQSSGSYTISTLGKKFDTVGFIHLSTKKQIPVVRDAIYKGRDDLVILKVASARLKDKLKWEPSDGELFPHYYGIIKTDWVQEVIPVGRF